MLDLLLIVLLEDRTPEPTEVKAGPLGFAIWIFMILAVVVLAFSLVKQLRKAQSAKDAGLYGDEPVSTDEATDDATDKATDKAIDEATDDATGNDSEPYDGSDTGSRS